MKEGMAMLETFDSINEWQRATFPDATIAGELKHLDEEWDEFKSAETPREMIEEAVDLIILLASFIDNMTGSAGAQAAVDAKMRRNRARSWNIGPDGTGRHV